jgi:hypothetical protein
MGSWEIFFCPGWPGTAVLPISASQVAKITGVRHWHLNQHLKDVERKIIFFFKVINL